MTDDKIELVEGEYGQFKAEKPARQIRTRSSSFQNIKSKFASFREKFRDMFDEEEEDEDENDIYAEGPNESANAVAKLQGELDKQVQKALTTDYTEDNFEKKINRSANVIARLEEKIKILSREDVPVNYVARRAIKLRNNMMQNLVYHTSNNYDALYRIGMEKRDAIMSDTPRTVQSQSTPMTDVYSSSKDEIRPVIETSVPDVVKPVIETPVADVVKPVLETPVVDVVRPVIDVPIAAIPNTSQDDINVDSGDLDRKSIMDAINESFNQAGVENDGPVDIPKEPVVSQEPIAPQEAFVSSSTDASAEIHEEPAVESIIIDKQAIRDAIEEAFRKIQTSDNSVEEKSIEPVSEASESVKVSRNNATSVRMDQFDVEGNRVPKHKKHSYTPMTDEEIRASQAKLGFDENGYRIDSAPVENVPSTKSVLLSPVQPVGQTMMPVDQSQADVPVRVEPVVVPEREDVSSIDLGDESNMFDIIPQAEDASVGVVSSGDSPRTMTVDDYESLKAKILQLKQREEESQKQKMEAERRAQEAATAAEEARVQYEASQAIYQDQMSRLRAYAKSLEEACDENARGIEAAERESRESERLVQSQREEIDRTNKIVSEIDVMMGEYPSEDDRPAIKKA